jgi:dTDP-4-dehydrorhamnose reductase
MYSVLDNARLRALGLDVMPTWQDALQAYLAMRRVRVAS